MPSLEYETCQSPVRIAGLYRPGWCKNVQKAGSEGRGGGFLIRPHDLSRKGQSKRYIAIIHYCYIYINSSHLQIKRVARGSADPSE